MSNMKTNFTEQYEKIIKARFPDFSFETLKSGQSLSDYITQHFTKAGVLRSGEDEVFDMMSEAAKEIKNLEEAACNDKKYPGF